MEINCQPAVSPDGRTLAYISPVSGRWGLAGSTGRSRHSGQPPRRQGRPSAPTQPAGTLVHYEESEYRMRPRWTPDGEALLFGSDEMGSNDVAMVAFDGGNPVV